MTNKEKLERALADIFNETSKKLDILRSTGEKEALLCGAFMVLEAFFKSANSADLGAFGREEFMGALRSHIYNEALLLQSPIGEEMKKVVESDNVKVFQSFSFAEMVQCAIGQPISFEQKMTLQNLGFVSAFERQK